MFMTRGKPNVPNIKTDTDGTDQSKRRIWLRILVLSESIMIQGTNTLSMNTGLQNSPTPDQAPSGYRSGMGENTAKIQRLDYVSSKMSRPALDPFSSMVLWQENMKEMMHVCKRLGDARNED
jgi:hypothetical protein